MNYYVLQEKVLETRIKNFQVPRLEVGFPLNALTMVKRFSYFVLPNEICN